MTSSTASDVSRPFSTRSDSSADIRYMVLPRRPAGTDGWNEERLASIVTRDCMVGVAVPAVPMAIA